MLNSKALKQRYSTDILMLVIMFSVLVVLSLGLFYFLSIIQVS